MYVEFDLDFLGIVVPKVGVCITQEPNELLDTCHKTKLPGVVGWNGIKLAYEVIIQKYGVLSWSKLVISGTELLCKAITILNSFLYLYI